jgi:hypothetical protein
MFRKLVTSTIVALALIGAGATRASADTCTAANLSPINKQFGPFCIEGVVPDLDVAAAVTNLTANVAKTGATLTLSVTLNSTTNFLVGDWVLIDQEKMLITAKTANSLSVTRAQLATTAAAHSSGASVVDLKSVNNDPAQGSKELGPSNGSNTKLNVINTASPPMLDATNPNGQTDLNTVWLKSALGPNRAGNETDHLWLYYAWARDSNSGSGFISLELNGIGADPVACKYDTLDDATLTAGCNPFANRRQNDLMFVWDQSGSSHAVYVRTFVETNTTTHAGAWTAPDPLDLSKAGVEYSADLFRGEMAVDLSLVTVGASGGCITFANVIPGTVTGNSDTADYKDVVLKIFKLVSNCGIVTVSKVTTPAKTPGTFKFNLHDTTTIFPEDVDADCADSTDHSQCEGTLTVTTDQTEDPKKTIQDLAQGPYKLVESLIADNFSLVSIVCTPETGSAVTLTTADTTFPVKAGETTSCVITNSVNVGSLQVIKVVSNGFGLTKACTDFKFTLDSTEYPWPVGCSSTFDNLAVGSSHSVTETGQQTGYHVSYGNDCNDLTIVAGTTKTCTITNTAEQNGVGSVTRQRVLLFDRAILSNLRRDQTQSDNGTMSLKFITYATSAACAADTTGAGSGETVNFNLPNSTDTGITVGSTGSPAIEIKLDTAGSSDTTMWWRALFHQSGSSAPNADFLTPCTETTRVVINQ